MLFAIKTISTFPKTCLITSVTTLFLPMVLYLSLGVSVEYLFSEDAVAQRSSRNS